MVDSTIGRKKDSYMTIFSLKKTLNNLKLHLGALSLGPEQKKVSGECCNSDLKSLNSALLVGAMDVDLIMWS